MAKIGEKVGNWILRKLIGSGGQGQVFEASKSEGEHLVAIKVIRTVHPKRRSRFLQEISIHAALSSQEAENIMPVIDHNLEELQNGGIRGFIVMPRAETSLERERNLLTGRIELCLEIFEGVVNGIAQAHKAGVFHRDIKPGNILFLDRTLKTPLISDFGICLLRDIPDEERVTEFGETVGAKFFMAPEQERGGKVDITAAADIYALGKLLHYMLTDRYLYREELEKAFSPEEYGADARYRTIHDSILTRTIRVDPNERIQTADELLKIIRGLRRGGTTGPGTPSGSGGGGVSGGSIGSLSTNSEELAYQEFTRLLSRKEIGPVALEFDQIKQEFRQVWSSIYDSIRESPANAKSASEQLISALPRSTALAMAIARCNADELFPPLKRLLEFIMRSSEGQSGYRALFTVPHVLAGFLYMATSFVALQCQSWNILYRVLTEKFEWYYESSRPLFDYGFEFTYFFHPDSLGRLANKTHDFYRERLNSDPLIGTLGYSDKSLLDAYLQVQFLMSLRVAQLIQQGEDRMFWPDFGRFNGYRILPLLDRMYYDEDYSNHVLRSFNESRDEFFGTLNDRLALLSQRFRNSNFHWDSLKSYEPRTNT